MARKRSLDPRFFKNGELYDAEARTGLPVMLTFAGLWGQCDRRGIFEWKARELKLEILPYHMVDFEQVLVALEQALFIRSYDVGGRRYGIIPSFPRWQTFHHNEKPSDAPDEPPRMHIVRRNESGPIPSQPEPDTVLASPLDGSASPKDDTIRPNDTSIPPLDGSAQRLSVIGYRLSDSVIGDRLSVIGATAEPPELSLVSNSDGSTPNREEASVVPREMYEVQERELLAACEPHVGLAIKALMSRHRQPYTVVYELWACANGMRHLRGKHTGNTVTIEHVITAIWEMAANDANWNVSHFRGYVMRCADRPPAMPNAEERKLVKIEAEARKFAAPASVIGERTDDGAIVSRPIELVEDSEEQRAERKRLREEAMRKMRAEFHRNQGEAKAS